jgi:hypothetical protein
MLLIRLDGPDGEMLGVLDFSGLPAELGALRARLEEHRKEDGSLAEMAYRGATMALCSVEVFDGEGSVTLRTVDDVVVHVAEDSLYATGKLDSEPGRSWPVRWDGLL